MGCIWMLQWDNGLQQTDKLVNKWFTKSRVNVLPWLLQSPDLVVLKSYGVISKKQFTAVTTKINNLPDLQIGQDIVGYFSSRQVLPWVSIKIVTLGKSCPEQQSLLLLLASSQPSQISHIVPCRITSGSTCSTPITAPLLVSASIAQLVELPALVRSVSAYMCSSPTVGVILWVQL